VSAIFARAAEQWQDMRRDYERELSHQYLKALEGTGGVLVNKEGRALGIDGYTLLSGPLARAQRYASWELQEWWESHPRLTLAVYESQWLAGTE
jgi:hypothetical protein